MKKVNNDELTKIIEIIVEDDDKELVEIVFDIVTEINKLRIGKKTSIAKLINYNPEKNPKTKLVDPLKQSKVSQYINAVCQKIGIKLECDDNRLRGLAYYCEFTTKKINYNFKNRQKLVSEKLNINIDVIKKSSRMIPFTNVMIIYLTENYKVLPKNYKGGITILIDKLGDMMIGSSGLSEKQLLENFKNGKRTPISTFSKGPSVDKIKERILHMPVNMQFTFKDLFYNYIDIDERMKRELCYSICNWLERNNFVDLKISTNQFNPYGDECLSLLSETLTLKQEKENYLKFNNLSYEYKCSIGNSQCLKQFKISKTNLAFLSEKNKNLYIIDDITLMHNIYNKFLSHVKAVSKQKKDNKTSTGIITESTWYKKRFFQKSPDAFKVCEFFEETLKNYGHIN